MTLGEMVAQYRAQHQGNYGGNVHKSLPTQQPMQQVPVDQGPQEPNFGGGLSGLMNRMAYLKWGLGRDQADPNGAFNNLF